MADQKKQMRRDIRLSPRTMRVTANALRCQAVEIVGGEDALRQAAQTYITGAVRTKRQQAAINLLYMRWGVLVALGEKCDYFEWDETSECLTGSSSIEHGL